MRTGFGSDIGSSMGPPEIWTCVIWAMCTRMGATARSFLPPWGWSSMACGQPPFRSGNRKLSDPFGQETRTRMHHHTAKGVGERPEPTSKRRTGSKADPGPASGLGRSPPKPNSTCRRRPCRNRQRPARSNRPNQCRRSTCSVLRSSVLVTCSLP